MAAVALAVVVCSPRIDSRGNLPDPDKLAEIKPGKHSRDDVAEILGSPSSIGVFDQETWYYISKRTEAVAFFEPEVAERQVIIVHFNKNRLRPMPPGDNVRSLVRSQCLELRK